MKKAIVFSPGSAGLSIIQMLGMRGIPCISMDCKRVPGTRRVGTYSKYAKHVQCPDPLIDEEEFINFIYDFAKKEKEKPILFPTLDHWAISLAKYKTKLEEVSALCVGNLKAVELFVEKDRFYDFAEVKQWTTPKTWTTEQAAKLEAAQFPIIAKPKTKLSLTNPKAKGSFKNISIAHEMLRLTILEDREALNHFIEANRGFIDGLIFQEYIKGMADRMYSVGVYADQESEILAAFTGKKVRGYPALYGDCTVGINHSVPEYVMEITAKVVMEMQYTGIAEFEYKQDEKTGMFRLIEINPRPWSWIGITEKCPDNLPFIAYCDLAGGEIGMVAQKPQHVEVTQDREVIQDGEVLYVKVLQDLINSLFRYTKDYPRWTKTFIQWQKSIQAKHIICAEFNARDWPVMLAGVSYYLILSPIKGLVKKLLKSKY
jgi:D-aspartate ligase